MKEILKNKFAVAITTVVASFAFTFGLIKGKEFILYLLQLDEPEAALVVNEDDLEPLVIGDRGNPEEYEVPRTVAEIVVEDIGPESEPSGSEKAEDKSDVPIASSEDEDAGASKEVVYTESVGEVPLQGDLSSEPRSVVFSNADFVTESDDVADEEDAASFAVQSGSPTTIDTPSIPNSPPADAADDGVAADVSLDMGEAVELSASTSSNGTGVGLNTGPAATAVEVSPESVVVDVSTTDSPVEVAVEAESSDVPDAVVLPSDVRRTDGRVVIGQRGSATANSLYSNALAGSVSGLIGGMSRPARSSERVQFRAVDSTISAAERKAATAAGNPVVPNAGVPATVSAGANGTSVSVAPQVPAGVTPPQAPTTSSTGGAHLIVPRGNSVLPSGLGVNAGGVSLKVNVGIAQ